jgi:hypothetical protein
MSYDEFPDEMSLQFRLHVLCVYAQSTLALLNELTADGPDSLEDADRKAIDESAEQFERIWFEIVKIKKQARG